MKEMREMKRMCKKLRENQSRMRIRGNARIANIMDLDSIALTYQPEMLQTHMRQLNQSSWDVVTFLADSTFTLLPENRFDGDDSFTAKESAKNKVAKKMFLRRAAVALHRRIFHSQTVAASCHAKVANASAASLSSKMEYLNQYGSEGSTWRGRHKDI